MGHHQHRQQLRVVLSAGVFGVTNGDSGRCGTSMDAAATALNTDANRNVGCTGRASMNCGGSAAAHIYAARADSPPRPDPFSCLAALIAPETAVPTA